MKVVYITCASKPEAKKLAFLLLKSKLIACANIYKIDSLYNWEEKVMDEEEFVLWCKSSDQKIPEIEKLVRENHSYDLPCITHFDADANADYKEWVFSETKTQ